MHGDLEPPPGYVRVSELNTTLFVGGLVTFGAMYGMSVGYGAANGFSEGLGWTVAPLVGPFVAMSSRDFSCPAFTSSTPDSITEQYQDCQNKMLAEATTVAVLSGLGIGQLIGSGLMLFGVLDREESWVRADLTQPTARFVPTFSPGFTGAVVFGSF